MNEPMNEGPIASAVASAAGTAAKKVGSALGTVAKSAVSSIGKAIANKAAKKVAPSLISSALQTLATTGKANPTMLTAIQPLMSTVVTILSTPALRSQFFKLVSQAQALSAAGAQPNAAMAPAGPTRPAPTTAPAPAPAARESLENLRRDFLMESENPSDKVTLNIPLFLRLMEYAKEDAKTDMDLHDVTEKVIALSEHGDVLTMDHYDQIVSGPSGGEVTQEITKESVNECGMVPTSATGKSQTRFTVSKTTTDASGAGSVNVSGDAKDTETLNQLLKLAGLDLVVSEQPAAQEVSPCGAAAVVDVEPAHAVSIAPEFDDGPDMGSSSYSTNGTTLKDLLVNRMRDKFAQ